ncbi:Uncharacterised protein [Serratia entomophila]|uniref:Sea29 n=1 Tax=Serratia entomophila TaxID=42906 RepID=A7M7E1_9GAMM|nr:MULTISPECIES: hypothetical protein [Serratia]ABU23782.1 Sea29 [Serratia entomophila]UIW20913.1 hypothetical protein KHA73_24105 [Serratia entomophila]ULG11184.1 Sea29 [Serratia entomophila]ULG11503.1 Sea29 [Serratia entomophila]ULG12294.1 Sea29 [Serratia entomophila]
MTMADFRQMAAKMDQHLQQLDVEGGYSLHMVIVDLVVNLRREWQSMADAFSSGHAD